MTAVPRWVIFCEARSDSRLATDLIDRVLRERCGAWVGEQLDHHPDGVREWVRDERGEPWFDVHQVYGYARARGIPMKRGFFGERPASPGATMLHQAARVAAKEPGEPVLALVLVWDADQQPEDRREGLSQGRQAALALAVEGFEVVVGCPEPNRESWVLSGFTPGDDDERERLDRERQRLGLWPHERPEDLTAQDEAALKHTKRVLHSLTKGDAAREERCWSETPLDVLRARGQSNGLAEYLRDVETQLCPQVDGVARAPR